MPTATSGTAAAAKPELLIYILLTPERLAVLKERFVVHLATDRETRTADTGRLGAGVRLLLTDGTIGITAEQLALLPKLEFIAASGAGYEGVALAEARERGIVVVHGRGANSSCVADHAMALLLAVVRDVPALDRAIRDGEWPRRNRPQLAGKTLGIIGLGEIGHAIARRAEAFGMTIAYHNRRPRPESAYRYFDSAVGLATAADVLVISAPGGSDTRYLVDEKVLAALGPEGFLINVGRGSVVDTQALIAALRNGTIAGAGIDTFENEPNIAPEFRTLPNIVMTPHGAGFAPETAENSFEIFLRTIDAHLAGKPVLTAVP
jgi:lactate dehydrogenase-like 2-hydroxyacid dehydrogenase